MKKEFNGMALHIERIAAIYKRITGKEIPPDVLRGLVAILVVEVLADLGIITQSILSQSKFYQLISNSLNPFLQDPDVQREGMQICAVFAQDGKYPAISVILPQLRDLLWMLDRESLQGKSSVGSRHLKKKLGIYETPLFLAKFLSVVIHHFDPDVSSVLDPASGSGNLLIPFCTNENVTKLCAIDTDELGLLLAEINILTATRQVKENKPSFHAIRGDFLSLNVPSSMDVVVSNPPWGLPTESLLQYKKGDFPVSYKNQADSWALFLEKSSQILKQNRGIIAFIIPNTLCLNPNFEEMRRYLLDSFTILFILNLGEGIFPLVTQPAMLLIARKTQAPQNHEILVKIFQPEKHRESKAVQLSAWLPSPSNNLSLFLQSSDKFDQHSFRIGPGSRLEIFTHPEENCLIQKIFSTCPYTLGDFVANSRGVEIGKRAEVIQCPECKRWNPPPKWRQERAGKSALCNHCKAQIQDLPSLKKVNIIEKITLPREDLGRHEVEILVGEQISKFAIKDHYRVHTDLQGINYKPNHIYKSPKILVRKTGREINAAIDWEDRMTVQVVYIFQVKSRVPHPITIEILLSLLNSRLLLFYYYHRFGDPEKRNYAHYIQTNLKNLPIPNLSESSNRYLNEMAEIIKKYPKFGQEGFNIEDQRKLDAAVDRLYGLSPEESDLVRKWSDQF